MQYSVKKSDGPARIGEMICNKKKVITPSLAFLNTKRYPAPLYADMQLSNCNSDTNKPNIEVGSSIFSSSKINSCGELSINNYFIYPKDVSKELHLSSLQYNHSNGSQCCLISPCLDVMNETIQHTNATLFIVTNTSQIFSQQSKFVEFLVNLRERIGYQKMIYIPCIAEPSNMSLLSYMGVDIFDSTSAIISARKKILFFPYGNIHIDDISEMACRCPICHTISEPSTLGFKEILEHNYSALYSEINHVRNAIASGRIRELVETRISAYPILTAMLKILDFNHYNFLEERTPIFRKNTLRCTTKHSLQRVEVKRFQSYLQSRYSKPDSTRILLLLPCSAKKPYSFSKSHRLFKKELSKIKNSAVIHEVIITSPLGIVPRDIELIYPASRYDISVSGHWDEDEKLMIRTIMKNYLQNNQYDHILVHVDQSIQEFILDMMDNPLITCTPQPTSKQSLESLTSTLHDLTCNYPNISANKKAFDDISSLASFQFGNKNAKMFLQNCKIIGKYPYKKIIEGSTQLGMITKDRGFISLTIQGAIKLSSSQGFFVEIYDDFNLIGSVFAPGIKDADPAIRSGDEVIVKRNNTVCGVGVAQMNGKEMKQLNHGEAVRIRHRC
ncbi:MAG: archaeosine synthase subunit alpha [Thermoplasmatota archaeon]